MLKRRMKTANRANHADRPDFALLAPEFRLLHFARNWQIHS